MTTGRDYRTFGSDKRAASRTIVRVNVSDLSTTPQGVSRIFIPFAGFDGQKLAGTGALVWEGELLKD